MNSKKKLLRKIKRLEREIYFQRIVKRIFPISWKRHEEILLDRISSLNMAHRQDIAKIENVVGNLLLRLTKITLDKSFDNSDLHLTLNISGALLHEFKNSEHKSLELISRQVARQIEHELLNRLINQPHTF